MIFNVIDKNRWVAVAIVLYVGVLLSLIKWGIPGERGPFLYHMDEWHQLMAVRSLAREGTSNTVGAANGPVFQFLVSLFWVAPAIVSGWLNLDAITTPVTGLVVQERLFILLRLNTLFFGVGTILTLSYILKRLRAPQSFVLFLALAPAWVLLSNYFKYDIALSFWVSASFAAYLYFGARPSLWRYILAGVPTALAVATKISGLPIFCSYVVAYFLYTKNKKEYWPWLSYGLTTAFLLFCILGIPDLIFLSKGEYLEFLYDNIVRVPQQTNQFIVPGGPWVYLLIHQLPTQFGYGWLLITLIAAGVVLHKNILRRTIRVSSDEKLLVTTIVVFFISLLPLKMYMVGNRAVVLLPFLTVAAAVLYKHAVAHLKKNTHKIIPIVFLCGSLILQGLQAYAWFTVRSDTDPRTSASMWILNNIPPGTTIGLEAIPLYQMVPDLILGDFYRNEYLPEYQSLYSYEIVSAQTTQLPAFVIITNASSAKFVRGTAKSQLLGSVTQLGYTKKATFEPRWLEFKYFGTERDFYFSGLPAMPNDVVVYSRN